MIVAVEHEENEEMEKISPPPGVTVRDVELFKKVQQTTSEVKQYFFLSHSTAMVFIWLTWVFKNVNIG